MIVFSSLLWWVSKWNSFPNKKKVGRDLILFIGNWLDSCCCLTIFHLKKKKTIIVHFDVLMTVKSYRLVLQISCEFGLQRMFCPQSKNLYLENFNDIRNTFVTCVFVFFPLQSNSPSYHFDSLLFTGKI